MIVRNAAAQLTALVTIIIVQTAYSIAAARLLGVEAFGQFSFVFSVTQILLIGCDLGLHNTALRNISRYAAEGRHSDAEKLFGDFFSLKIVISLALVGGAVMVSFVVPESTGGRFTMLLFAAGMFFQSLNAALNVTFQARDKLYLGSFNNVVMGVLNLGIAVTFMLLGGRVQALGLAYLLAAGAAFLFNYRVFVQRVHAFRLGNLSRGRSLARESLPVGVGTLFNTIAARIDIPLLVLLVGAYQTGIYSAAYRIYGSLLNIPIAIFSAVLPAMASFGEKREGVRALFDRSIAVMIAISLSLAIGFSVFSEILISMLYGKAYAASAVILGILAWSLIPAFVGMAFSHVILSQGVLTRRLPGIAAAAMAANVGLNLWLIPKMGNRGAALSTLATETILAILYAWGAAEFLFGKTAAGMHVRVQ